MSVILDYAVEYGAAADGPIAPAIGRISRRVGRVPEEVTADRGYGQLAVENDLHYLGVRTVAIPARPPPQPPAPNVCRSSPGHRQQWSSGHFRGRSDQEITTLSPPG
jgi:hypothetical protein